MTQLTDKVFAVEVPDDAKNFRFGKSERLKAKLFYNTTLDYFAGSQFIDLPPGTWRFLFTTNQATEEDARKVVEPYTLRGNIRYTDFTHEYMWCDNAKDSLNSLLRSKDLDPKKNYAIIEKMK